MRTNNGSALVDYVVPTALIGIIVGIGMFAMYKEGAIKKFFMASSDMSQESGGKLVINSNPKISNNLVANKPVVYSQLESDSNNNKDNNDDDDEKNNVESNNASINSVECKNNSCSIDFGGYTLNGIPEDFNEVIETSASSGGTETLSGLLDQIAAAAENDSSVNSDLASLFRKLSNNGHGIASKQGEIENLVNTIDVTSSSGLESQMSKYKSLIGNINSEDFKTTLNKINSLPEATNSNEKAMIQTVNTLAQEVLKINNNLVSTSTTSIAAVEGSMAQYQKDYQETQTLIEPFNVMSAVSGIKSSVKSPNVSTVTNLHSAIICNTGHGKDTGTKCGG